MFLTQQGGFIVKPISILLGEIFNLIYNLLDKIGIVNIGVAIILFTVLTRLCLLPSQIKQNKSSKVRNYIQPEINKVIKKYKNKKDQDSIIAQSRETREIQEKYGIGSTTGCLGSIIQLPIFLAVYRVVQNIPAYVDKIYNLYHPIAKAIYDDPEAITKLTEFQSENATLKAVTLNPDNINTIVDVLAKFSADTWGNFSALFNNQGAVVDAINANVDSINHAYTFFGINLTSVPGFALTTAIIIPVLSMVFQFLSMHAAPQQTDSGDPAQEASMRTMKMMMNIMPIMSFFICVNVPSGVGLYWAAGSLISFFTSLIINYYFAHCDMDKIIEKSKEKAAKKLAKKKASGKKSFMEKLQEAAYGEQEAQARVNSNVASASLKSYTSNTMNANNGNNVKYRAGSLAAKANAMQRYSENNNGGK